MAKVDPRPCVVCRKPTKSTVCSGDCAQRWYTYLYATPLPRPEPVAMYPERPQPEDVNETGDYQPPVRKPRTRR